MKENESKSFLSHAFTDLMASLAVIFILLTVVFIKNSSERSQESKKVVRGQLAGLLEKNNLPLEADIREPLMLSVRVGESLLKFATGSSSLSPQAEKFLDDFMPALASELCTEPIRSTLDAVIIEGHTDRSGENSEVGTENNIRLSQNRSFSVLTRSLSALRHNNQIYDCMLKLALASGRGSSLPVLSNNEYSADLSRRVEIKIRLKSSEQEFSLKERTKL